MIKINNISKSFDENENPVIKNFSYTFPDTGIVCLFGMSGCGKSTLFNLLIGLIKPDCGTIDGTSGMKKSVVFQENRLIPWLNGEDNVLAIKNDIATCNILLNECSMINDMHKLPKEMSGGMQRRVAIARALAFDGDVFFLDEPFQGIDSSTKNEIIASLKKRMSKKLCFFITHSMEDALALSDIILLVKSRPFEITEEIICKKISSKNKFKK